MSHALVPWLLAGTCKSTFKVPRKSALNDAACMHCFLYEPRITRYTFMETGSMREEEMVHCID